MKRRIRPHRTARGPTRRRITQETIDQIGDLRRQGHTFAEIGARLGYSERTARRYVGNAEPGFSSLRETRSQKLARPNCSERFARELLEILYQDVRLNGLTMKWRGDRPVYGGPPSILFLSEAERLIRDRLEGTGGLALGLFA